MRSKTDVETFVADWVAKNVQGMTGLAALPAEVDRLAANLTGDARAEGISGGELNRVFGDIDDYLNAQCQQALDQRQPQPATDPQPNG
jgi:hypothetical protein